MKKERKGKVYLIGAGPGDPGLLTCRGREAILQADALVYDSLVDPRILDLNPAAQRIYAGKKPLMKSKSICRSPKTYVQQSETNQTVAKLAGEGKIVARLKGGDPFIFGRGGEEADLLKKKKIPFEIVPGVSAGTAVPAYAGIPLTDRRFSSTVIFVTGHEDPEKNQPLVNWKMLAGIKGTIVAFMGVKNLSKFVRVLLREGKPSRTPAVIIEQGTLPEQKVVEGTLATIVPRAQKAGICPPALTVIGEIGDLRFRLKWFEKKPLFGKTVLLTRPEAQAGDLQKKLEEAGARVLSGPLIEILPPANWGPVDQALRNIRSFDWIIFNSLNGAEMFFYRLSGLKQDARKLSAVKIAAVGAKTERFLLQKGIRADLVPERYTSEALFKALRGKEEIRGRHFLLPRSEIAPEDFRKNLEAEGGTVTEVTAYRTVSAVKDRKKMRKWLLAQPLDYVFFASASAVREWRALFPKPKEFPGRAVSIGPETTRALKQAGIRPVLEAKTHTVEGMLEVLTHGSN